MQCNNLSLEKVIPRNTELKFTGSFQTTCTRRQAHMWIYIHSHRLEEEEVRALIRWGGGLRCEEADEAVNCAVGLKFPNEFGGI